MSTQPYIPLYIGDWDRDAGCLTLEAEGALLKIIFKLWDSPDRGRLIISFSRLSILLKKSLSDAQKIVHELHENGTLNIEFLPDDKVKIESRRMLKEIAEKESKSLTYSENGKKGGRPKKANGKQIKSKLKPKQKPIPDNDIDIECDNEIENDIDFGLEYLNKATGRNFKIKSRSSRKDLKARFKEGHTRQEVTEVIDIKCLKWLGDSEWEMYLRPQTLFTYDNFNKYLNDVELAKAKGYTAKQIKGNQGKDPRVFKEDLTEQALAALARDMAKSNRS